MACVQCLSRLWFTAVEREEGEEPKVVGSRVVAIDVNMHNNAHIRVPSGSR